MCVHRHPVDSERVNFGECSIAALLPTSNFSPEVKFNFSYSVMGHELRKFSRVATKKTLLLVTVITSLKVNALRRVLRCGNSDVTGRQGKKRTFALLKESSLLYSQIQFGWLLLWPLIRGNLATLIVRCDRMPRWNMRDVSKFLHGHHV